MSEGPNIDQLLVLGTDYRCVLNFIPKCIFKPTQIGKLLRS